MSFSDRVSALDMRASARLTRAKPPRWFRLLVVWSSRSGDGWLWMVAGGLVLAFGGPARLAAFWSGLLAAVSAVSLFMALKRRCGRSRPILPHVWASIAAPDQFSFPSGHSMVAFAVSAALAGFYPDASPFLLAAAVAVAGSRLVLGLHYLTDVLVGAFIGGVLGIGWFELGRRLAG